MLVSAVQRSEPVICITEFFPIMISYSILSIVPCTIQWALIVKMCILLEEEGQPAREEQMQAWGADAAGSPSRCVSKALVTQRAGPWRPSLTKQGVNYCSSSSNRPPF